MLQGNKNTIVEFYTLQSYSSKVKYLLRKKKLENLLALDTAYRKCKRKILKEKQMMHDTYSGPHKERKSIREGTNTIKTFLILA